VLLGYVPPPCTKYCAKTDDSDITTFFVVVGCVAAAALLGYLVKVEFDHRLRTRGTSATAVITDLRGRRVIPHSPEMKVDVTLRVTAPDGEEFETWTTAELPIIGMPQVGWSVPVRYSERDRYRIALVGEALPPPDAAASHPMER
jgi:hypothetical protein